MHLKTSPLTYLSVCYSWRQLAQRAGVAETSPPSVDGFQDLGIPLYYDDPENVQLESPCVVVIPCARETWHNFALRESESLTWLGARQVIPTEKKVISEDAIPVLLWSSGHHGGSQPFAKIIDNSVLVFYADIIASTFFMLSRQEETVVPDRDEHGRFPATASVAYKQGFLDRPIVDEYALILREWLKVLLPRWEPKQRSFSVQLSHDVDHVRPFANVMNAVRSVGGDLLKRRSFKRTWHTVAKTAAQLISPERSSYVRGIHTLAHLSHKSGLGDDVFYFMASGPGPFGGGYDPASPLVRKRIADLRRKGFEIGLHASYDSFDHPGSLVGEKARLEAAAGRPVSAVRQHYLRFRVPDTWRHLEAAGLACDSTMAYADHEGFRCGTCHPFHPFDIQRDREMNICELPLIATDATLRHYRRLSPEQGKSKLLRLARRCKQVEGTFTLLWHNSSLDGDWSEWGDTYRQTVKALGKLSKRDLLRGTHLKTEICPPCESA